MSKVAPMSGSLPGSRAVPLHSNTGGQDAQPLEVAQNGDVEALDVVYSLGRRIASTPWLFYGRLRG